MTEFLHSKIFQAFLLLTFGALVFYLQVIDQHKRQMEDPFKYTYHRAPWYEKLWMLVLAGNKLASAATFMFMMVLLLVILNQ